MMRAAAAVGRIFLSVLVGALVTGHCAAQKQLPLAVVLDGSWWNIRNLLAALALHKVIIIASTAVLLGCVALTFVLMRRRKFLSHKSRPKEWATPNDLDDVRRVADKAREEAAYARRLASEKRDPVGLEPTNPNFDKLWERLRSVEERLQSIESKLTESPLLQKDLQRVSEALNSSRLRQESKPRATSVAAGGRTGLALAAVVNRWIEEGAKDRCRLLTLAQQIGMKDVWLANIDNAINTQTGGKFECAFRTSDDGAWIWTRVPGTQDFWAAPADAQLMGMGKVPHQLDRMFDGMEGAKQAFRFETVYQPCYLRSNGDRYTLLRRGALKLVGSAPVQNMSLPQPLETYRIALPDAAASWPRGSDIGGMLASWINNIENQVRDYGVDLGQLQERATAPSYGGPTVATAAFERVKLTVDRQRQDLETLRAELSQLRGTIEARLAVAAISVVPSANAAVSPDRTESIVSDRNDQAIVVPPQLASDIPLEHAMPVSATSTSRANERAVESRASSNEASTVVVSAAQSTVPLDFKSAQGPPDNWKEALWNARNRPGSEPRVIDVPSPELYVMRVRNLRDAMVELNPGGIFAVVHVKKDSGNATVEVHETEESSTGEVICRVCCARHTWQLALSCGQPPTDPLYLLFPATSLGKGNFAAGYSALVDDLPSSLFSTEAYDPAQLKLQDPHSATYTVWRKMTLNQVGSGRN